MVGRYFDKRRSLASGMALAGGSMGTLLIPQIIRRLIDVFASKGAMLIYSGTIYYHKIKVANFAIIHTRSVQIKLGGTYLIMQESDNHFTQLIDLFPILYIVKCLQ